MPDPNYLKIAGSFFALLNPFVLVPVFLALAGDLTRKKRFRIAFVSTIAVFVIMMLSIFTGNYLLEVFGINVDQFRVAGGIVILLMSINMVRAQKDNMRYTGKEHEEATTKGENVAVVPLAIPLMAGPASISAAIINAQICDTAESRTVFVGIILGLCFVLWLAMMLAEEIKRILGHTGQQILTRIMGLVLLALSIEFITTGIKNIFHLT